MPGPKQISTTSSEALRVAAASVVLLAAALAWRTTSAADPEPLSARLPAKTAAAAAKKPATDQRDVLLLLDEGPLHLRLHVALGGVSLAEARRQYVAKLVETLDANKDGKISRTEASRSPLLRTKQRPGAAKFLESLGAQQNMTPRDVQQKVEAAGGNLVAYREDLTSSQNDLEIFKLLDADKSGALEAGELQNAGSLVMAKDEDGDECVSFQEFFPAPPPPDPMLVAVGMVAPTRTVPDPIPKVIKDTTTDPVIIQRILKKYDKNRDFRLSVAELGWTKERVSLLDGDGNELLDAEELADIAQVQPDVELSADLLDSQTEGGIIGVVGLGGERLDDASRPDYVKVGLTPAVLTFSHRNLDPIAAAIDDAMRQFNALDADANGYLDRDETSARLRFQRELFDLMDADADDKVFVDEVKAFVTAKAEPAASTCRVNLYDTGNGFFMALDANADGRVSVREMRRANGSLAQLDRDGKAGVGQTEPARHFHIEFVRGSYQLFGPSEQLSAQTPNFQRRLPSGPIWFQRMDRNNDGDLTWNEFLGPREIFHDLDGDGDFLLDPKEAAQAN